MNPRRGTPGQFILYWFARLPLVWAVLAGFAASALLESAEWYVRVPVIGLVSLVILGLGYIAKARLLVQMRAVPPPVEGTPTPPRRVRRRR